MQFQFGVAQIALEVSPGMVTYCLIAVAAAYVLAEAIRAYAKGR